MAVTVAQLKQKQRLAGLRVRAELETFISSTCTCGTEAERKTAKLPCLGGGSTEG